MSFTAKRQLYFGDLVYWLCGGVTIAGVVALVIIFTVLI